MLAAALAVPLVILFERQAVGEVSRRLVGIAVVITVAGVLASLVAGRNESEEGARSAEVRLAMIERARIALEGTTVFGAGPGQAQQYRVARRLADTDTPLENSYANLAVSLGPVGMALFVALLLSVVAAGFRGGTSVGDAGAMLAVLVAAGGFYAFESAGVSLFVLLAVFASNIFRARAATTLSSSKMRAAEARHKPRPMRSPTGASIPIQPTYPQGP